MNKVFSLLAGFALVGALCGCYRAPCEDDYCTIPATNNPGLTRHANDFQPGICY